MRSNDSNMTQFGIILHMQWKYWIFFSNISEDRQSYATVFHSDNQLLLPLFALK